MFSSIVLALKSPQLPVFNLSKPWCGVRLRDLNDRTNILKYLLSFFCDIYLLQWKSQSSSPWLDLLPATFSQKVTAAALDSGCNSHPSAHNHHTAHVLTSAHSIASAQHCKALSACLQLLVNHARIAMMSPWRASTCCPLRTDGLSARPKLLLF